MSNHHDHHHCTDENCSCHSNQKLELKYPCSWSYKIIGFSEDQLNLAIESVIPNREHTRSVSNISKKGKYVSMNLELTVHDEEDRTGIYKNLSSHPAIKIVL